MLIKYKLLTFQSTFTILYNATFRKLYKHLLVLLSVDEQWKEAKNNDLIKKNIISHLINSYG